MRGPRCVLASRNRSRRINARLKGNSRRRGCEDRLVVRTGDQVRRLTFREFYRRQGQGERDRKLNSRINNFPCASKIDKCPHSPIPPRRLRVRPLLVYQHLRGPFAPLIFSACYPCRRILPGSQVPRRKKEHTRNKKDEPK